MKNFIKYHLPPVVVIPLMIAGIHCQAASANWQDVTGGPIITSPQVVTERTASYDKDCNGVEDTGFVPQVHLTSGECAYLGVGIQNIGNSPAYRVIVNIPLPANTEILGVSGDIPEILQAGQTATLVYHIKKN